MNYVLRRIGHPDKLKKVFVERLTEPLHLNLISAFVAAFGTYRAKVAFDLVVRQQYAYPILFAADLARSRGLKRITVAEMGVASGAGLLNMCRIAERTKAATGVEIRVVGFDTGSGMPPAVDYRDLPELYQAGDYPMNTEALKRSIPQFAQLIIGELKDTIAPFVATLSKDAPLGFVAIDVDYYSSAKHALDLLTGPPECYLPITPVYLDDIGSFACSAWTGEMLAVSEFNEEQTLRKIAPVTLLRSRRIFKNTQWIDRMFACHIHDHPVRSANALRGHRRYIPNEYIN